MPRSRVDTHNNRAKKRSGQGLTGLTEIRDTQWREFFARPTIEVARGLIGATVLRVIPKSALDAGGLVAGRIVETEAYLPLVDPACHAYRGPTKRTAGMFGWPGKAYVYFIYGMYNCLNVTTEPAGIGGAVLIRALEPTRGLDLMRNRRRKGTPDALLARGPGNLCRALGVDTSLNGIDLHSGELMLELAKSDRTTPIAVGPRVGIKVAPRWPLRFADANSASVSNPRKNLRLLCAASDSI
jgi:DNA-3-methyladenine glycosylase